MNQQGIYFLAFENSCTDLNVGALGRIHFKSGWHIYAGSALGKTGILRLKRHFSLAERKDKKPRWHVDYLLLSDDFMLRYAFFAETGKRLECTAANNFGGDSISGFGCSDCKCNSHLFYREIDPFSDLNDAFSLSGLNPYVIRRDFWKIPESL